jgi:transcriptional regulator of heat shock response
MHDLTQRQIEILKSLIEEYIETAEPVGSETLEKKHSLSASPATIRNEMVRLTSYGYLKKTHISSGRVPTPAAMKFYVKQLMKEKELSVAEEVSMKEKVWDTRDREHEFLKDVTRELAAKTGVVAIVATDSGEYFISGYANILDMPEFYDIDLTKTLLSAIDDFECFKPLFEAAGTDDEIHILVGEELGPILSAGSYGFVFKRYVTSENGGGEIGVIGPTRLNYTYIVPTVRYFGNLINEIARGW